MRFYVLAHFTGDSRGVMGQGCSWECALTSGTPLICLAQSPCCRAFSRPGRMQHCNPKAEDRAGEKSCKSPTQHLGFCWSIESFQLNPFLFQEAKQILFLWMGENWELVTPFRHYAGYFTVSGTHRKLQEIWIYQFPFFSSEISSSCNNPTSLPKDYELLNLYACANILLT